MKLLLIAAVVALLGVSMAKPSVDRKELMQLLRKLVDSDMEKKDVVDTTMFEGLNAEPEPLFDEFIDFSQALDVSELENTKEGIRAAVESAKSIVEKVENALDTSEEDITLSTIISALEDNIYPLFDEFDGESFMESFKRVNIQMLRGAVGGTIGAERDEAGVDFEQANKGQLVDDLLQKVYSLYHAAEVAIEQSFRILEEEIDGEAARPCDQVLSYLFEQPRGQSGKRSEGDIDAEELLGKLAETIGCIRHNLKIVRERLALETPAGAVIPLEMRPSDLPLPTLIRANALLNHVFGLGWWTTMVVDIVYYTISEGAGNNDKRGFAALETSHHFKLRNYYNRNYHSVKAHSKKAHKN